MFLTKKALKLALDARDEAATDLLNEWWADVKLVERKLQDQLQAQEATVRRLHHELALRDIAQAENTRRVKAVMALTGVTEHVLPARPEVCVYAKEQA